MGLPQNESIGISRDDCDRDSQTQYRVPTLILDQVRRRIWAFGLFILILGVCFSRTLYALVQFAVHGDLYSHIILIPFISVYLILIKRQQIVLDSEPSHKLAVITFAAGIGVVAIGLLLRVRAEMQTQDYLATMTLASVIFLWGGCLLVFGLAAVRLFAFPLLFLLFMVPFPNSLQQQLQALLQGSSAAAARLLFQISGTPVLQQGTVIQLPGFSFEVAPECSGIHSSFVLFITSFVAGHLLLRNLWAKALLVLFVVPLAIIRNAIRIFTIGQLCVRISPDMIHSYIHQRGGPIFFAGSLIPLFLLLYFLARLELRKLRTSSSRAV